jgi:hypothetical protein
VEVLLLLEHLVVKDVVGVVQEEVGVEEDQQQQHRSSSRVVKEEQQQYRSSSIISPEKGDALRRLLLPSRCSNTSSSPKERDARQRGRLVPKPPLPPRHLQKLAVLTGIQSFWRILTGLLLGPRSWPENSGLFISNAVQGKRDMIYLRWKGYEPCGTETHPLQTSTRQMSRPRNDNSANVLDDEGGMQIVLESCNGRREVRRSPSIRPLILQKQRPVTEAKELN